MPCGNVYVGESPSHVNTYAISGSHSNGMHYYITQNANAIYSRRLIDRICNSYSLFLKEQILFLMSITIVQSIAVNYLLGIKISHMISYVKWYLK
jgi:hypothetical protein